MSASREKKKRQNADVAEQSSSNAAANTGKKVLYAVIAVAAIAVIVFFSLVSTGFFARHSTAAIANGHKVTPVMANYFYAGEYNKISDYLSYLVDTETPLNKQAYLDDSFETWADYLMDAAMKTASTIYALNDDAAANGFVLSDDGKAQIDSQLSMVDLYASMQGVSADAFLASNYGTGATRATYEEYLKLNYLANEYVDSTTAAFSFGDDEITAYYEAHPEEFDGVNFRVFSLTTSMVEAGEGEDALALCEEAAKEIVAASVSELAYQEQVINAVPEESKETYQNTDQTIRKDYTKSRVSTQYADWLFDPARTEGDVTYVPNAEENPTGYYVLYYIGQADHSTRLPNIRHILVSVEEDADESTVKKAEVEAQSYLDEFLAGEQTEEAFGALADEHSADSPAGGLYEKLYPGQTVAAFNDWCFDPARQAGDTGIVRTNYGFHVMYYCGLTDTTYQQYMVEQTLINQAANEWYNGLTADNTYALKSFGMIFTVA